MLQDLSNQDHSLEKASVQQNHYTNQLGDVENETFSQEMISNGSCLLPITSQYYQNRPESFLNNSWSHEQNFDAQFSSQDPSQPLIYQKLMNNGFIPFQNSSPFSNTGKSIDYRQGNFGYFGEDINNSQNFQGEDLTTVPQSNISNLLCSPDLSSSISLNQSNTELENSQNTNQISNFDIQQLFNLDQNEDQKLREREQNAVIWFEQFRNATNNQTPLNNNESSSVNQQQINQFSDNPDMAQEYYPFRQIYQHPHHHDLDLSTQSKEQQQQQQQQQSNDHSNNSGGDFENTLSKRQKSSRYSGYNENRSTYPDNNTRTTGNNNKEKSGSGKQRTMSTSKLDGSSFLPRLLNNHNHPSMVTHMNGQNSRSLDLFFNLQSNNNNNNNDNSTDSSPNSHSYPGNNCNNNNHSSSSFINQTAFDNLQSLVNSTKTSGIINSLNLTSHPFTSVQNYPMDYFGLTANSNVFNDIIMNNNNLPNAIGINQNIPLLNHHHHHHSQNQNQVHHQKTNNSNRKNSIVKTSTASTVSGAKKMKFNEISSSEEDHHNNRNNTTTNSSSNTTTTTNGQYNNQTVFPDSTTPSTPESSVRPYNGNTNNNSNQINGFLNSNNTTTTATKSLQEAEMNFNLKLSSLSNGINNMKTPSNEISYEDATSTSNDSSTGAMTTTIYFWQYNAQCKGPKAVKLVGEGVDSPLGSSSPSSYDMSTSGTSRSSLNYCPIASQSLPGYPLVVFEDPVQKRQDLVHCSKLRRGDGNDVTPNINRLRLMGDELERLSGQIARQGEIIMTGGVNGPNANSLSGILAQNPNACPQTINIRIDQGSLAALDPASAIEQSWCVEEAKREKNKLASKICRLKKKAFHESNKIKYTGLGLEYCELANIIIQLKQMLIAKRNGTSTTITFEETFDLNPSNNNNNVSSSGNSSATTATRKRKRNEKNSSTSSGDVQQSGIIVPGESLYEQAINLKNTLHTTLVAGRTDPFVEEVLQLSRTNHSRSSLLKRLSSSNNLTIDSVNNNSQLNGCYSESNSRSATPNSQKSKNQCKSSCLITNGGSIPQQQSYIDYSIGGDPSGNPQTLHQSLHQDYSSHNLENGSNNHNNPFRHPLASHQQSMSGQQQETSSGAAMLYSSYHHLLANSTDHQQHQHHHGHLHLQQVSSTATTTGGSGGSEQHQFHHQHLHHEQHQQASKFSEQTEEALKQQQQQVQDASQFLGYHQQSMYEMDPNEAAAVAYLSSAQNSLIIAANIGCNSSTDFNQLLNESESASTEANTSNVDQESMFNGSGTSSSSYYQSNTSAHNIQQTISSSEGLNQSSSSSASIYSASQKSTAVNGNNNSNSSTPIDATIGLDLIPNASSEKGPVLKALTTGVFEDEEIKIGDDDMEEALNCTTTERYSDKA